MKRGMWLGVLLVSLFLVAAAGFGIVSAGEPDDIGTTDIKATKMTTDAPTADASATTESQPSEDESRAAATPAVPSGSRSQASVAQAGSRTSVPVRLRVKDVALDAPLDATGVARRRVDADPR